MKTYLVERQPTGVICVVTENNSDKELNPRLDLMNHSPTGYEFGCEGSGPAQLSLALLADCFGNDDERALELHQWFKREVVAQHQEQKWQITSDEILRIVSRF